ncbi:Ribosomal RNA processing protein 36 [Orchesella cincta]|uniref:rRNA biogenesis protein RRP36 n=1 Tax=Orchesella cincta TaxID=48709 RepID=A0A1D2MPK9_ORCCI|nr:Ribosomal RNA processing protein 36 [Orchesella cincta]
MGKKEKLKRNSETVVQAPAESKSGKPENDLYSQIFADTTDDDEAVQSKTTPKPTGTRGKKKDNSQLLLVQQQTKPSRKLPKTPAVVKNVTSTGSEKATRNLKQVESDSSESEAEEVIYDDGVEDDEDDNMDVVEEEASEGNESETNQQPDEEQSGGDEEEEESENEDDTKKTPLRSQLKDLSFIELEALKQKMGLKEYNEAMFGNKTGKKQGKKTKFERKNKNRPLEISSKRRVPKFREVVKVSKKSQKKDPRFDDACGEYSEKFFNTEYNFLRDLQKTEAEHLKKNMKTVDDNDKKREIRKFIQKVSDKEKAIVAKEKEDKRDLQLKEENKKRLEEGKRPFFVKKSTKKFMDLVEKYDELKSSGGLEKYLKKKRKKNAVRDRKFLKPLK